MPSPAGNPTMTHLAAIFAALRWTVLSSIDRSFSANAVVLSYLS